MMLSAVTEEAKIIIDSAPAYGPLRPDAYAKALPQRAGALARVISHPKIADAAERYHVADAAAGMAQTRFRRLARRSAYSGFAAAVLGGVILYLGSDASQEALRANLGLAQFVCLVVSLLYAFLLFWSKPYRAWRTERGKAEALRLRVFALMMGGHAEAQHDELPLLPLQVECFRRHLLKDQRDFFARRAPEHRRTVIVWKVAAGFAFFLVTCASLPQLLRLEPFGLLPDMVRDLIERVPLDKGGYVLVGLIGVSIQGLLAALAVISPAQHNADTYGAMCKSLDEYLGTSLDAARDNAVKLGRAAVQEFTDGVSQVLADEAKEWLLLQQALSEIVAPRVIPAGPRTST